jgi:hypothetical protein
MAVQAVIAVTAVDLVIAAMTEDDVVTLHATQAVETVVADQDVVVVRAFEVFDGLEHITCGIARIEKRLQQLCCQTGLGADIAGPVGASATADDVLARAAVQNVVAVAAIKRVVPVFAKQHVVIVDGKGLAGEDRGRAACHQVCAVCVMDEAARAIAAPVVQQPVDVGWVGQFCQCVIVDFLRAADVIEHANVANGGVVAEADVADRGNAARVGRKTRECTCSPST